MFLFRDQHFYFLGDCDDLFLRGFDTNWFIEFYWFEIYFPINYNHYPINSFILVILSIYYWYFPRCTWFLLIQSILLVICPIPWFYFCFSWNYVMFIDFILIIPRLFSSDFICVDLICFLIQLFESANFLFLSLIFQFVFLFTDLYFFLTFCFSPLKCSESQWSSIPVRIG